MCKNRKGFSLVEVIICIMIISILTIILAPTLWAHIERSRANKDALAMDEVRNSVLMAASHNQDVYDELTSLRQYENVSCYIDSNTESTYEYYVLRRDENGNVDQYAFDDDCRLMDETPYYLAGKMRGVTLTFVVNSMTHDEPYVVDFANGVLNKYTNDPKPLTDYPNLYHCIKQLVNSQIKLTSQTYRGSEYTIFIRLGTSGGNEEHAMDAVHIYGQFSGTNLQLGHTYTKAQQ